MRKIKQQTAHIGKIELLPKTSFIETMAVWGRLEQSVLKKITLFIIHFKRHICVTNHAHVN